MDTKRRLSMEATGDQDEPPARRVPEVFETFYTREFPRMVDLAYALSGSRIASEDLAQEAMIAAHRDWERIGALDRPGAWVRRVVTNKSASFYHRWKAEVRAFARLGPVRGTPPARLDVEARDVWRTVRRLPTRQAQAIALFYLDELTVAETAEVMGCTENTVKVHLHQARKTLATRFDAEERLT
ncbi:MAG: SigE family RNA polymerase sigma factor [Acidimicrobiia bacterium]|nr:MAG: SigE family RNA polymerase sigma factor [Acidimicrobiia bacterium]